MAGLYSDSYYKNKKKKRQATPFVITAPPYGSFTPIQPTDSERAQMRARQRVADRDPDLEGYQRRTYRLQDGTVQHSEPHMLPPHLDQRHPRVLENDPDLQPDREMVDPEKLLPRVAAVATVDDALRQVDDLLSTVFTQVKSLTEAAQKLLDQVTPQGQDEAIHSAEQLLWILTDAVGPWMQEMDHRFGEIVDASPDPVTSAWSTPHSLDAEEL